MATQPVEEVYGEAWETTAESHRKLLSLSVGWRCRNARSLEEAANHLQIDGEVDTGPCCPQM